MTPVQNILDYPQALCNQVIRLARSAGDVLLDHFDESGGMPFTTKPDGSPVTVADALAEDVIMTSLRDMTPDTPVIAEEAVARGDIPSFDPAGYAWLIDALDGTRGFIRGDKDFTVNIGLVKNGLPILGVIYAPALGELYAGHGVGTARRMLDDTGSEKNIHVRKPLREGLTVAVSGGGAPTPQRDAFLEQFKVAKVLQRNSSIKLCLIAAGKADISLRFKEISFWDLAAGHAILESAGGCMTDMNGHPLRYLQNKNDFNLSGFFASSGHVDLAQMYAEHHATP
jgi:3'(2'), 5'-bisphosphate nucleotidase